MELCKEITLSKTEHIWSGHEQFSVMNCIHFMWCAVCSLAACNASGFLPGFHFLISSILWIFLESLGLCTISFTLSCTDAENLQYVKSQFCLTLNVPNQDFGCKEQMIIVIHLQISYSCPELLEVFCIWIRISTQKSTSLETGPTIGKTIWNISSFLPCPFIPSARTLSRHLYSHDFRCTWTSPLSLQSIIYKLLKQTQPVLHCRHLSGSCTVPWMSFAGSDTIAFSCAWVYCTGHLWSPLQFLLLAMACLEITLLQIDFVPCLEAQQRLRAIFSGFSCLTSLSVTQFLK